MAFNEKISKALRSAATHLENSMTALDQKDENLFTDSVWHVAAELEYALFLLSVTLPNESETLKSQPNPELKKTETSLILIEIGKLLNEAEKSVANGMLLEAYKSSYAARSCILKIQEDLAKKKREAFKKKS